MDSFPPNNDKVCFAFPTLLLLPPSLFRTHSHKKKRHSTFIIYPPPPRVSSQLSYQARIWEPLKWLDPRPSPMTTQKEEELKRLYFFILLFASSHGSVNGNDSLPLMTTQMELRRKRRCLLLYYELSLPYSVRKKRKYVYFYFFGFAFLCILFCAHIGGVDRRMLRPSVWKLSAIVPVCEWLCCFLCDECRAWCAKNGMYPPPVYGLHPAKLTEHHAGHSTHKKQHRHSQTGHSSWQFPDGGS